MTLLTLYDSLDSLKGSGKAVAGSGLTVKRVGRV